jgi:anti-anti-sigma factor
MAPAVEGYMRITQRTDRDAVIFEIADELTYTTRKVFTAAVERAKQAGCRHLILHVALVTFIDSAGLGLIALAAQQCKAENRRLSLVGPQGTVKHLLELANIPKMVPVYPTEAAAIAGQAA